MAADKKLPERIDRFDGPFRFLSNFAYLADGKTLEHYYQAAKRVTEVDGEWVMDARTPIEAKKRGRQITLRSDWPEVKNDEMLRLLRLKFARETFRSQLLATGNAHLEEGNWWHDQYWGNCTCPAHAGVPGANWLGRLLMQVRAELAALAREELADDESNQSAR